MKQAALKMLFPFLKNICGGNEVLIIEIEKNVFDSLPINLIGHACFEPMVPVYQEGMRQKSGQEAHEYRIEFYNTLSHGQQALFGFFTYYNHAIRSNHEFQRISRHYISQHIFSVVKRGAEYFNDNDMCELLFKIEQTVSENCQSDISADLSELYKQLYEIAPRTLMKIGTCIKENPTEFICFKY